MDTNLNLDLLSGGDHKWLCDFWHAMLRDNSVTVLTYQNLQSMKSKQELKEIPVQTTGCDNHWFKPRLPFSWAIKTQVDNLILIADGGW